MNIQNHFMRLISACGSSQGILAFSLFLLVVVLTVRLGMGFEFPVPWNDETAFISQGFEFSRKGSFYVYGLNMDRILMWMPPGYMILLATVYKLFGYSFEISRWVSCLLYLGTFSIALAILRRLEWNAWRRGVAVLLTFHAFISPYSLAISNIARMETLYTLIFLGSLLAMLGQKYTIGLALVLIGATVHFNAVYMLLPYAALALWKIVRREDMRVGPIEMLVLVIAVTALAGYGIFALKNIGGFIEDMKFQFDYKLGSPVMDGPSGWLKIGLMSLVPITQLILLKRFSSEVVLSLYATSFMALALNGHNMWYSFAFVFALWLLLLSLLVSGGNIEIRHRWRVISGFFSLLLLFPFGYYSWSKSNVFDPLWPRAELLQKHFLPLEEVNKIRTFIAGLPTGAKISFGYTGVEPYFFKDFANVNARWSISSHSVTQVLPARNNEYRVVCDSALYPKYVFIYDWDGFARNGETSTCTIHALNETRPST